MEKAPDLTNIRIELHDETSTLTLRLTDELEKVTSFTLGPQGLSAVLQELLAVVVNWKDFPAEEAREVTGVVPATQLTFGQGQDISKGYLMVSTGPVQLAFELPSQEILRAVTAFSERVQLVPMGRGGKTH